MATGLHRDEQDKHTCMDKIITNSKLEREEA